MDVYDEERRKVIQAEAETVQREAEISSGAQTMYAKRWRYIDRWIASLAAALAAVAGIGELAKLLSFSWAGGIAIASALAGAVSATISARQTMEKAVGSASAYRSLGQDARIFICIDLDSLSTGDARDRFDKLVDRYQHLNQDAVVPSTKARRVAEQQIPICWRISARRAKSIARSQRSEAPTALPMWDDETIGGGTEVPGSCPVHETRGWCMAVPRTRARACSGVPQWVAFPVFGGSDACT